MHPHALSTPAIVLLHQDFKWRALRRLGKAAFAMDCATLAQSISQ
jgi:hypothetical protein